MIYKINQLLVLFFAAYLFSFTCASAEEPRVKPVIVIDPGHGGEELGAMGTARLMKKEIVLDISQKLASLIRQRLRAIVRLTRDKDINLSLSDRTKFANDLHAELFISVHANASENKQVKGIETYYLDNTNDRSSIRLAERENFVVGGIKNNSDLGIIISDLIQSGKMDDSKKLAKSVQGNLISRISKAYSGMNDLGVKKAPFYVLVGAHMPCILVEVSFIDNDLEGKRLATEKYRGMIAESIFEGIVDYYEDKLNVSQ